MNDETSIIHEIQAAMGNIDLDPDEVPSAIYTASAKLIASDRACISTLSAALAASDAEVKRLREAMNRIATDDSISITQVVDLAAAALAKETP